MSDGTDDQRIVALLGGGLLCDPASGVWRTTTFEDTGDQFGVLGDRLRVLAGHCLWKHDPRITLWLLGGRGQCAELPQAPPVAQAMRQELRALGVPSDVIRTEEASGTTYRQLLALQDIIAEHTAAHIAIVSNAWHLPRIRAMLERADPLAALRSLMAGGDVGLVAAEDVLTADDPAQWRDYVQSVYAQEGLRRRITLEAEGVRQIRAGSYVWR